MRILRYITNMKIHTVISILEEVAPLALQESYDNSGLQTGDPDADINSALLCVDVTEDVVREAAELNAGLIISHHPPLFHPLRHISYDSYIERAIIDAIRNNIAVYSCHTNLDSAPGGMSFALGKILGINDMSPVQPSRLLAGAGMGVFGHLNSEMPLLDFLHTVKQTLGLKCIRYSNPNKTLIRNVALCTGAGASLTRDAKLLGADIYISSDFKYNDFLDADRDIVIADVGHFESEYCAITLMYEIITKKITNFAVYKSERSLNPVNYLV